MFEFLETLAVSSVIGGRSYDAFILSILKAAGAEAVATLKPSHLRDLEPGIRVIDPAQPVA
jgi:hypothetical protein